MRFIRDGEKGGGGRMEVEGEGDYIPIATHTHVHRLHCHHQNDSCIKMGSEENHFNVSLIVRDKATKRCPQTTTFEEKGESKRIRTELPLLTSLTIALPLGHTGSRVPAVAKILQFTSASPVPRNVVFGSLFSSSL